MFVIQSRRYCVHSAPTSILTKIQQTLFFQHQPIPCKAANVGELQAVPEPYEFSPRFCT